LSGLAILLYPIAYLALARVALIERFPTTHALIDDWYNHAVYAPMFLIGFALAGTERPWLAIERARWHALLFAVGGWAFLCGYFAVYGDGSNVPPDGLKLFQRVVFAAQQWLPIVAMLGFARRHWNRDGAA